MYKRQLLGSLLASIACGIIGTYIVTRRLVFISGGITHASFGGIGLGLYAGISPCLLYTSNDTIDGVVPIYSLLMARGNRKIVSIQEVWLSETGDLFERKEGDTIRNTCSAGMEVRFFRPGASRLQTLYYFCTDISNEGLQANRPLQEFMDRFDAETTATVSYTHLETDERVCGQFIGA